MAGIIISLDSINATSTQHVTEELVQKSPDSCAKRNKSRAHISWYVLTSKTEDTIHMTSNDTYNLYMGVYSLVDVVMVSYL